MSSDTSISKFEIRGQVYYVKLDLLQNKHDLFHIRVFDGDNSWSGRFSQEFARKFAERVDEKEEEYSKQVTTVLTKGDSEFTCDFSLVQGDLETATFSWKKIFEDGVTVVHGSVPVHRDVNSESKDTLLDFLILQNNYLKYTIQEFGIKTKGLNDELEKYKNELEKIVDIKTSLEESLYGKFVQLLNTKKRRIQLLEGHVENCEGLSKTCASYSDLD